MEERNPTQEAEDRLGRFAERFLPKTAGASAIADATPLRAPRQEMDVRAAVETRPEMLVRAGDFVFLKPVTATGSSRKEGLIDIGTGVTTITIPMSMVDRIEPGRPAVGERCRIEGDSFIRTVIAIVDELAWVRSQDGDSIVFLNKLARA